MDRGAHIAGRIKRYMIFFTVGAAAPLMEAAVVGLAFPDEYYYELRRHYTHMKGFVYRRAERPGAYFYRASGRLMCWWTSRNSV